MTIGSTMPRDSIVIIESTVDPGTIRGVCIPALEGTGLRCGADFTVAHSPERISPGDAAHSLAGTSRVVAGFDAKALRRAAAIYRRLVPAGVHEVSSIEVAELCKMVENAQRDVNIAFTNEVAMLCARLGLATREVLEACATKWNFHRYRPGLVGGHCIPVDPHYLLDRAERIGTTVRVVSAGRAVNDAMPSFVADQIISALPAGAGGKAPERVGVLGLCYKPNVADLRNSGGLELARLLAAAGLDVFVHDPLVSAGDGIQPDVKLVDIQDLVELDVLILAVRHRQFDELVPRMHQMLRDDGLLVDLTGTLDPPVTTRFWSL
jgi:UDP-N-acetyl-D-galactosamine dehydrogenase